jgi:hypothetical protein
MTLWSKSSPPRWVLPAVAKTSKTPSLIVKKRNIESTTTKIVDDDLGFTTRLVESVGDGGGGGFIDDAKNLEDSNSPGVLGSLTLSIIEVCRKNVQRLDQSNQ